MKRVAALSVSAFLAIAVSASGAFGSVKSTSGSKSVTLHLVEKDVAFNFVDNPPRQGFRSPPLIGDQFAFTSELLTQSSAHAGHLEASCIVSRGGVRALATCTGIFSLKGGTIALVGPADLTESAPDHIAVVGGTGAYEGVTGSLLSISRGENSLFADDTLHLIWP